jgi:hypothetical protein
MEVLVAVTEEVDCSSDAEAMDAIRLSLATRFALTSFAKPVSNEKWI